MAHIVDRLDMPSSYKDNKNRVNRDDERKLLANSTTLYVGNLSFFTTEAQIYELFSQCAEPSDGGGIKRIVMGLDRNNRTPCGFAFVEYYLHTEALASMRYISGTKLDERIIRCDLDPGYKEGRQFGRGKSGGQVRDEYRDDYDVGRGGWGHEAAQAKRRREAAAADTYAAEGGLGREGANVPVGASGDAPTRKRARSEDEQDEDEGVREAPPMRGERDDEAD